MHYPPKHYCRPSMPSQRNMTKRFHVSGALNNLDTITLWCMSQLFSFFTVFFTRLHAPALYFSIAHVSSIFEHDKVHKTWPPKSPDPNPIQHPDRSMDKNKTPQDPKGSSQQPVEVPCPYADRSAL